MASRDDDDWVGEPPEGRHTRDRAKPEFWWSQRPPRIARTPITMAAALTLLKKALTNGSQPTHAGSGPALPPL